MIYVSKEKQRKVLCYICGEFYDPKTSQNLTFMAEDTFLYSLQTMQAL
jgi:hypothetical protein